MNGFHQGSGVLIQSYLPIIISSATVYLFIVLAIRLFGKKELAQLSVIDLVFILLISNAVQNAMVGSNSTLAGGLVAASTLFIINYVLKALLLQSPGLNRLIQGDPLMLVYKGEVIQKHLDQSQISLEELEAAIREHGVETIKQVNLAILEVDGNISVLSDDFKNKSMKKRKGHKVISKST
ncbi:MAG TPA: YetF domain-containing protein [Syntrophomonadaceae bacterium]|nr:YetF domain-containing protein [Syntrophomonadaceae bacterium]